MKYISVLILPFVHKKNRDKKYLGFNFVGKRRPLAHGLPFSFFCRKAATFGSWVAFCTKKKNRDKKYLGFNFVGKRRLERPTPTSRT